MPRPTIAAVVEAGVSTKGTASGPGAASWAPPRPRRTLSSMAFTCVLTLARLSIILGRTPRAFAPLPTAPAGLTRLAVLLSGVQVGGVELGLQGVLRVNGRRPVLVFLPGHGATRLQARRTTPTPAVPCEVAANPSWALGRLARPLSVGPTDLVRSRPAPAVPPAPTTIPASLMAH